MTLEINNILYDNPDWRVENGLGELRLHSEKTFMQVMTDLALNAGDTITQYNDNKEIVSIWYVEGMASISMPGENDSNVITVKYYLTQLAHDAQDTLINDLDDTTLSVLELAGIISTTKREVEDEVKKLGDAVEDFRIQLTNIQERFNTLINNVNRCENLYNTLADRVAKLENK